MYFLCLFLLEMLNSANIFKDIYLSKLFLIFVIINLGIFVVKKNKKQI